MNFWVNAFFVCVGMAVADFCWAMWARKTTAGEKVGAGLYSVGIVLVNSYVVYEYVHDRRLIFAAAVGAFIGTVLPIYWDEFKKKRAANKAPQT